MTQHAPHAPELPKACLDGPSRDIILLVDQRRPVAPSTTIRNKLRWFLHEFSPAGCATRSALAS